MQWLQLFTLSQRHKMDAKQNIRFREYGYTRDMEETLRNVGDGRDEGLATQSANQIKHLKDALKQLVKVVEIKNKENNSQFAWNEIVEAKVALDD